MILIKLPWHAVPDGALIVGPSGRVWRVMIAALSGVPNAILTDPENIEASVAVPINLAAETTVIQPASSMQSALAVLSRYFQIELIGS